MRRAVELYADFHQREPQRFGSFGRMKIPSRMVCVGDAVTMYYTSDKLNPATGADEGMQAYYHEHKPNVKVYIAGSGQPGMQTRVPRRILDSTHLVFLGRCDGFDYVRPDGEMVEARPTRPYPEWFSTPDGRGLLVIDSKRKVLAGLWGGSLHIEPRGIVG
jgi:hypothetical protein